MRGRGGTSGALEAAKAQAERQSWRREEPELLWGAVVAVAGSRGSYTRKGGSEPAAGAWPTGLIWAAEGEATDL